MSWLDEVAPDHEGPCGKAWKIALESSADRSQSDPRWAVTLDANYLVFAPAAHPAWAWHVLIVQSLREVPGVDPPRKRYQAAEYEVMALALSPKLPPPDPRDWPLGKTPPAVKLLMPPDVVVHFHGVDDAQVVEIAELAARACTLGVLVPDSDHQQTWEMSISTTVQHYSAGFH